MKKCNGCRKIKPRRDFYKNNRSRCKSCVIKKTRKWMKENPELVKKINKKVRSTPEYKKNQSIYYRKWAKINRPGKKQLKKRRLHND